MLSQIARHARIGEQSVDPFGLVKRFVGPKLKLGRELEAEPLRHWQGLRARPDDRPAPLLEQLEPGLLLTSGHYRNGVLLAPATAVWVLQQLEQQNT